MELILMIPAAIMLFVGVILSAVFWRLFAYAAIILGILYFVVEAVKGLL